MSKAEMLTDEQWAFLEPLFQEERTGAGCPQVHTDREVLNGILWVLRTGAAWMDLPDRFPPSSICYRRFSDPLDEALAGQGIEFVAPHRKNRKEAPMQDSRVLRRYQRRWKFERLFAWLNKFRKIITRWEHCAERYICLVCIDFCMVLLRRSIKSTL